MVSDVMGRIEARDGSDGARESKLELKVCERCGGLWLRPAGSRWIYCGPCKLKVNDLPPVGLQPTRERGRKSRAATSKKERVQ